MNDEILDYEISSTFGKGSDSAGPDGISPVVLGAPTGLTAFNIGGTTIHQLVGLPATETVNNG